jgi:hypothetical protein
MPLLAQILRPHCRRQLAAGTGAGEGHQVFDMDGDRQQPCRRP